VSALRCVLVLVLTAVILPLSAEATFHLWDITEVDSNADGSVQYVELFTTTNNQDELIGHFLKSGSTLANFVFPTDLDPDASGNGNNATPNRYFLVATPASASQPGAVTPDFVFASPNFLDAVADSLDFSG